MKCPPFLRKASKTAEEAPSRHIKLEDLQAKGPSDSSKVPPLENAALFSPCGRTLNKSVQNEYFRGLGLARYQRQLQENFLLLLDRDGCLTVLCYYCQKIHSPISSKETSTGTSHMSACARHDLANGWLHNQFNISMVQSAMKMHRMGLKMTVVPCRQEDHFSAGEWETPDEKWKLEAFIKGGELCLRAQTWVIGQRNQNLADVEMPETVRGPCGHYLQMSRLMISMECARSRPRRTHPDQKCETCAAFKYCDMCSTKFEIRAVKVRRQFRIRFTATLILGSGIHPDDPDWADWPLAFGPLEQKAVEPYSHSFKGTGDTSKAGVSTSKLEQSWRRVGRTASALTGSFSHRAKLGRKMQENYDRS